MEVLLIIDPDEVDEKFKKSVGDAGCLATKLELDKEAAGLVNADKK
jgi:hypothetical protein